MQRYTHIRIDRDAVIKVPRRTGGTGEGDLYLYFAETEDKNEVPLICGGEIAEALRAWISGSKVYPVSDNGVLNIYGHLVDGVTAEKALGQFPLPVEYGTMFNDVQDGPYVGNIKPNELQGLRIPSAVPTIDINKVIKGINERK